MRGKSKKWFKIFLLMIMLLLAGCGKEEIQREDYVRTNPATNGMSMIMKSDNGYYYSAVSGEKMALHYFDTASSQNIFLCSKPECRHDGDAFCTATSNKYNVDSVYFYCDNLYLNVVEVTETEYLYKLIRVSADGTDLTEITTYMTVNNTSMSAIYGEEPMMIHRGVVVLSYRLVNANDVGIGVTGTYLYNLATGELTELPQLEYEKESRGRERFTGYGNYIYYNTQYERKNTLSRYCLTDGSIENMELLRTYVGIFEVMDEDTIYYYWESNLYEYIISTKENTQYENFFVDTKVLQSTVGEYTVEEPYNVSDLMSDGTYLYVGQGVEFRERSAGILGYHVYADMSIVDTLPYVRVLDRKLNEVVKVEISVKDLLGDYSYFSLAILDGMVYVKTAPTVFACRLEEFLKGGRPPFKPVYDHQDIEYLEYSQFQVPKVPPFGPENDH